MSTLVKRRYYKRRARTSRSLGLTYGRYYPQMRKERKYMTLSLPAIFPSLTSTWHEGSLSAYVADGADAVNDRVGNRILVHSLTVKGILSQGATAGVFDDAWNNVRMVIAMINRIDSGTPLGSVPVGMNVPLIAGATVLPITRVIEDMYIPLVASSQASSGYVPGLRYINKVYHFKKPIVIDYLGTGTNSDMQMLHIGFISDSAAAPSPGFISGFVSMNYTD